MVPAFTAAKWMAFGGAGFVSWVSSLMMEKKGYRPIHENTIEMSKCL